LVASLLGRLQQQGAVRPSSVGDRGAGVAGPAAIGTLEVHCPCFFDTRLVIGEQA